MNLSLSCFTLFQLFLLKGHCKSTAAQPHVRHGRVVARRQVPCRELSGGRSVSHTVNFKCDGGIGITAQNRPWPQCTLRDGRHVELQVQHVSAGTKDASLSTSSRKESSIMPREIRCQRRQHLFVLPIDGAPPNSYAESGVRRKRLALMDTPHTRSLEQITYDNQSYFTYDTPDDGRAGTLGDRMAGFHRCRAGALPIAWSAAHELRFAAAARFLLLINITILF